jgi:hypothetical protein
VLARLHRLSLGVGDLLTVGEPVSQRAAGPAHSKRDELFGVRRPGSALAGVPLPVALQYRASSGVLRTLIVQKLG